MSDLRVVHVNQNNSDSTNSTNSTSAVRTSDDADDIVENHYLEMSYDFKQRMMDKNKKINGLQKTLIIIYGLIDRFLAVEDLGFIEEVKAILESFLLIHLQIQEV